MACYKCKDTKSYKGLPCIACEITTRERVNIRNTIYIADPWRAKLIRAGMGNVRPMIDLIVDHGMTVMNNRGPREQAVLRSDLQLVRKVPFVHVKAGTTLDRVHRELSGIVETAAQAHQLHAKVAQTAGSGTEY